LLRSLERVGDQVGQEKEHTERVDLGGRKPEVEAHRTDGTGGVERELRVLLDKRGGCVNELPVSLVRATVPLDDADDGSEALVLGAKRRAEPGRAGVERERSFHGRGHGIGVFCPRTHVFTQASEKPGRGRQTRRTEPSTRESNEGTRKPSRESPVRGQQTAQLPGPDSRIGADERRRELIEHCHLVCLEATAAEGERHRAKVCLLADELIAHVVATKAVVPSGGVSHLRREDRTGGAR
jgi:hypothetical protein